jgi:hypothetical protein
MKGMWVRLPAMPVEGKLVSGYDGVAAGDRVRVQLVSVEMGFIDFTKAG